jgi:hypothetical protein
MMELPEWRIHLTHPGGTTTVSFHGTRAQADDRKPASWNMPKDPAEPNMWDRYETARVEAVGVPTPQEQPQ